MFYEKMWLPVFLGVFVLVNCNIAFGNVRDNKEATEYDKKMVSEMKILISINKRILQFKQKS